MRLSENGVSNSSDTEYGGLSTEYPMHSANPSVTTTNGHPSPLHPTNGLSNTNGSVGPLPYPHNTVTRVMPPGTQLYKDSTLSREEFVRLVIQSLRDVGYIESASTLEAESGYTLESSVASEFRESVLHGKWDTLEQSLSQMGLATENDVESAQFLISQQKYLELLEAGQISSALQILRNEIAPLHFGMDRLHLLSSLMMCSTTSELMQRSHWDGAAGTSRRQLLVDLQRFIPSSILIPPRRMDTLLNQSRSYQRQNCPYHNTNEEFSLYQDHTCTRSQFPTITTHILAEHDDEVWHLQWSHNGRYLASASKDKTVIIWSIGDETAPGVRECVVERQLKDHKYHVGMVAWSMDDSILLTGADNSIKMWNVQTGVCLRELLTHNQTVSALVWLPDGSGFISGSMDRKIVIWDSDGRQRESWGLTPNRILTLDISPNGRKLVVLGVLANPSLSSTPPSTTSLPSQVDVSMHAFPTASSKMEKRIVVYDFETREELAMIPMTGELTSVKISQDSRYALINHAPDEIQLWDLDTMRMTRKFGGHRQPRHVIRSCFGGINGNFVVSGSEDAKVYIWNRDTGALIEVLSGHQEGSVNSVAWNPRHAQIFASCSDDYTVHIWQPEPPEALNHSQEDMVIQDTVAKRKTWDGGGDVEKSMS